MKVNSSLALTLILLTLMLGAGLVSAAYGFALGREALRGVTQPDVRNVKEQKRPQGETLLRRNEVVLLREADILAKVKARMAGSSLKDKDNKEAAKPKQSATNPDVALASPQPGLPVVSRNQGVTMTVQSVRQQGGSLILAVSLRNDGIQPVRFLYSFLDVTDDKGRALSASTEGLPGELPPRSQTYSGTVSIPTAILDDSTSKLSLTLTDYPDQQLQLEAANIPVVR